MSKSTVNIHEAKTHFSKLIARVEKGERITVARAGKAVARLVPAEPARGGRLPADDPLLNLDELNGLGQSVLKPRKLSFESTPTTITHSPTARVSS